MQHVVVVGPQGCGKTRLAWKLKANFKCDLLIDDDSSPYTIEEQCRLYTRKVLFLTSENLVPNPRLYQLLSFDDAVKMMEGEL
jgi:shikimate kinase